MKVIPETRRATNFDVYVFNINKNTSLYILFTSTYMKYMFICSYENY